MTEPKIRSNSSWYDNAVFIFGAGRSGTTLIHSLLDNHAELVVWPFEFTYYRSYERLRKLVGARDGESIECSKLNDYFLSREDIQCFGDMHHYSMEAYMDLSKVNRKIFFEYMRSLPSNTKFSRREYLVHLIKAYRAAFCPDLSARAFVLCVQNIMDEVKDDFPEAKYIWAYRDPIDNYIAIKQDYFATAQNSHIGYVPRQRNSIYKYGLLEAASWPVYFTNKWAFRNQNDLAFSKVDIKGLQSNPESTMQQLAAFIGVEYRDALLDATFAGARFDSNLSSGKKSGGKILVTPFYDPKEHLTYFEHYFMRKVLLNNSECKSERFKSYCTFFDLLKNEMPNKILVRKKQQNVFIRLVLTAATFLAAYLNNRYFFLAYKYSNKCEWD